MRWVCVRDAAGRDCNWVLACSLGRTVPGRAGSWEKYQQVYMCDHQHGTLGMYIWC
jgi:hypothetical protein